MYMDMPAGCIGSGQPFGGSAYQEMAVQPCELAFGTTQPCLAEVNANIGFITSAATQLPAVE